MKRQPKPPTDDQVQLAKWVHEYGPEELKPQAHAVMSHALGHLPPKQKGKP